MQVQYLALNLQDLAPACTFYLCWWFILDSAKNIVCAVCLLKQDIGGIFLHSMSNHQQNRKVYWDSSEAGKLQKLYIKGYENLIEQCRHISDLLLLE